LPDNVYVVLERIFQIKLESNESNQHANGSDSTLVVRVINELLKDESLYECLIQEILNEVINNLQSRDETSLKQKTKSWDLLNSISTHKLNYKFDFSQFETLTLKYLIDLYNRTVRIRRNSDFIDKVLNEVKLQIIRQTATILSSFYSEVDK
jgi:hypothetical protein